MAGGLGAGGLAVQGMGADSMAPLDAAAMLALHSASHPNLAVASVLPMHPLPTAAPSLGAYGHHAGTALPVGIVPAGAGHVMPAAVMAAVAAHGGSYSPYDRTAPTHHHTC